jgi:hypothetical protein
MTKNVSLKLYYVTYSNFTFSKKFKSRILIRNNNWKKWKKVINELKSDNFNALCIFIRFGCLNIELGNFFSIWLKNDQKITRLSITEGSLNGIWVSITIIWGHLSKQIREIDIFHHFRPQMRWSFFEKLKNWAQFYVYPPRGVQNCFKVYNAIKLSLLSTFLTLFHFLNYYFGSKSTIWIFWKSEIWVSHIVQL